LQLGVALQIALLALSVVLLWKGADWLVESAARVGRKLGLTDVIIGLTIVAFGTSAPEFAVTFSAALGDKSDISVGNVVGSNIFNLGLIMGLCSLLMPLTTNREVVYRDGAVLIGTTAMLLWMLSDYTLERWEGAILFSGLVLYLATLVLFRRRWHALRDCYEDEEPCEDPLTEDVPEGEARWWDWPKLIAGIVGVVAGGHLLVESASALASALGVSEWAIAVTIVAAGTSAPELATSLTAAVKNLHGMSVGNLVGSDLFNLLGVLGAAGLLRELPVSTGAIPSVAMLTGMCVLVVFFMRTGWRLKRWEGIVLILIGLSRWVLDLAG
jgi:cation:H+ antiporter